jgi:hypothetical protein
VKVVGKIKTGFDHSNRVSMFVADLQRMWLTGSLQSRSQPVTTHPHQIAHLLPQPRFWIGNEFVAMCANYRIHKTSALRPKSLLTKKKAQNSIELMEKFDPQFLTRVHC